MDWKFFRQIIGIFFGVCLLLISAAILLYNLFMTPNGYEVALGFLNLFVFLAGLLLTVFNVANLPRDNEDSL